MPTIFSTIDERLLAGQLREEKRKQENKEQIISKENVNFLGKEETSNSFRKAVLMAKFQQAKQKLKQQKNIKKSNTVQAASGRALRWAWMMLTPSWGLSLIYINVHAFLSIIFPNMVCRLGEEWISPQRRGEMINRFSLIEWGILAVLDFAVFCIIIIMITLLGIIIHFIDDSIIGKISKFMLDLLSSI